MHLHSVDLKQDLINEKKKNEATNYQKMFGPNDDHNLR